MQKQSMEAAPTDFQCLSLSLFSFFVFNQIRLKMFRARPQLHALLEELFSHLLVSGEVQSWSSWNTSFSVPCVFGYTPGLAVVLWIPYLPTSWLFA